MAADFCKAYDCSKYFVMNCHTEFHTSPIDSSAVDTRSLTDGQTDSQSEILVFYIRRLCYVLTNG
jgi:hypothetical protein